ncbi:hypothetical protein CORC01_06725 [Colletotrichum orchidophilum]|uniref:Uncharacterized protein n=1 Tax=Colletotrichum orchidophilum TaxID=1209926 RepID=A0A1G4B9Q3_9PEZI|nr:uncharacterized protein CORC01_06725 [Colletotrichum orchidophilum]OHE98056.1 hypothetical protein CORC01_06725 [Colletotrichum orchidophilum]
MSIKKTPFAISVPRSDRLATRPSRCTKMSLSFSTTRDTIWASPLLPLERLYSLWHGLQSSYAALPQSVCIPAGIQMTPLTHKAPIDPNQHDK